MKTRRLIFLFASLLLFISAEAKIRYGVKGGYNISKMELSTNVMNSDHREGYYFGPTLKVDLIAGFDLDVAALYDSHSSNIQDFSGNNETIKKNSLLFQANLRKGFGLGDVLDVFVFGGPQWSKHIGKRNREVLDGAHLRWADMPMSINVGIGAMLFSNIELKACYNIASDNASDITIKYIIDEIKESPKSNAWQLGIAIYF